MWFGKERSVIIWERGGAVVVWERKICYSIGEMKPCCSLGKKELLHCIMREIKPCCRIRVEEGTYIMAEQWLCNVVCESKSPVVAC